jgi:hypothetical protein
MRSDDGEGAGNQHVEYRARRAADGMTARADPVGKIPLRYTQIYAPYDMPNDAMSTTSSGKQP